MSTPSREDIDISLSTHKLRFKATVLLAMGTLSIMLAMPAFAQEAKPDCQCRAPDGSMRDLGAVECVDITGTRKLVRCEMSTNTPFWKDIENTIGCPDV